MNTTPTTFTMDDPRHPRYEPLPVAAADANGGSAEAVPQEFPPEAATFTPGNRWQRYDRATPADTTGAPGTIELRGWKGERVTALAIAQHPGGFQELRFSATLAAPDGRAIPVRLDIVRYTLADGVPTADILDGTEQTAFFGVTRAVFISIDIPADAPPSASGILTAHINGVRRELPLTLAVDNLVLPPPSQWSAHIDFWQHPDAIARWHDVPMWSRAHFDFLKPAMHRLAATGQKTITTTLIDEAWGGQTYDRFRSMITWTKKTDGTWRYDYTDFDNWVAFMRDEIGITAQVSCYSMVPWSLTFAYFDEAAGRVLSPRLEPASPEYEAHWGPFLQDFTAHLKAKGWLGITKLAMDERPDELLLPALAIAKKYAPELGITAACHQPSNINESFYDASYGYSIADRIIPLAAKRRQLGQKTTFYVCCGPARPNTFLTSGLAESEWLPILAARYGLDGMLRWAWHSWGANPFANTDFGTWPTGDTALAYPGDRSSLRLEYLRDGIETFEKIAILRAHSNATPERLKPLEEAVAAFTIERGAQPGVHAEDLLRLERAIHAVAAEIL